MEFKNGSVLVGVNSAYFKAFLACCNPLRLPSVRNEFTPFCP